MMETACAFEEIQSYVSRYKLCINRSLKDFADELRLDSFKSILDLGSGKSPYKKLFRGAGKYISIDCREDSGADIVADVAFLPIKAKIVDVLLCIEVLEHIYPTKDALKEMHRVLKPGGHLIITVPFIIGRHDYADYFRFTEAALNRMLKENGFSIVKVKRRGGIFASLAGLFLSIPRQVFVSRSLKFMLYVLLSPLAIALPYLDRFDRGKDWTLGYEILAESVNYENSKML